MFVPFCLDRHNCRFSKFENLPRTSRHVGKFTLLDIEHNTLLKMARNDLWPLVTAWNYDCQEMLHHGHTACEQNAQTAGRHFFEQTLKKSVVYTLRIDWRNPRHTFCPERSG